MLRTLFAFFILIVLSSLPAAAQGPGVRRYFDDWLAACRGDGYCSAVSYVNPNPGDGRVADYWFRIGRHAEESYWELSFTPIKVMADPAQAFVLTVDDASETFSGVSEVAAYGALNDFFLLGKKAQAVMDRLMPGTSLAVAFTDEAGSPVKTNFSLDGLTAALIWIDEQQSRIGSERVAELPPVGLEPASRTLVGEVTMADIPAELIAQDSARPDRCDGFDIVSDQPFYRFPAGGEKTLYFLPCTGGAYNHFYSVYVGTDRWYDLQLFATPSYRAGWQAEEGIWLEGFDPETNQLRSYNLGRGMGDCGLRGLWQWTGNVFVMLEYRLQAECDASVEPGEFPLIYKNENPPDDLLR
jgi:hypothetical protein